MPTKNYIRVDRKLVGDRHDPYSEEYATVWCDGKVAVERVDSALSESSTVSFYNGGKVVRKIIIDFRAPIAWRQQLELKVDLLVKRCTGRTMSDWLEEYERDWFEDPIRFEM